MSPKNDCRRFCFLSTNQFSREFSNSRKGKEIVNVDVFLLYLTFDASLLLQRLTQCQNCIKRPGTERYYSVDSAHLCWWSRVQSVPLLGFQSAWTDGSVVSWLWYLRTQPLSKLSSVYGSKLVCSISKFYVFPVLCIIVCVLYSCKSSNVCCTIGRLMLLTEACWCDSRATQTIFTVSRWISKSIF